MPIKVGIALGIIDPAHHTVTGQLDHPRQPITIRKVAIAL